MVTRDKARELTAPSWVLLQHEVEELTGWKPRQSPEDILKQIAGSFCAGACP